MVFCWNAKERQGHREDPEFNHGRRAGVAAANSWPSPARWPTGLRPSLVLKTKLGRGRFGVGGVRGMLSAFNFSPRCHYRCQGKASHQNEPSKMKQTYRWLVSGAGVLMLVFGLLCLNYTKMGNTGHHAQVAQQRGWPPPSRGIASLGMVLAPLGAGLAGFAIGRRQKTDSAAA